MLRIVRADISEQKADAIVNCASSNPTIGAGVESALFVKGKRWLKANREKLGVIEHGHAKISKGGGSLQCKWVFHAVGPYWVDGKSGEIEALCNRLGIDFDTEEAILKSYIDAISPPKRRSSEQVYLAKQKKKLADHRANYLRPVSQAEQVPRPCRSCALALQSPGPDHRGFHFAGRLPSGGVGYGPLQRATEAAVRNLRRMTDARQAIPASGTPVHGPGPDLFVFVEVGQR